MQTRMQSVIETAADVAVGLVINVAMNWVLLPLVLHIPHPTASQNFWLTFIFTLVALARRYGMRRLFNHWHQVKPGSIPTVFSPSLQKGISK